MVRYRLARTFHSLKPNIAPVREPSQKGHHFPAINFQVRLLGFNGYPCAVSVSARQHTHTQRMGEPHIAIGPLQGGLYQL